MVAAPGESFDSKRTGWPIVVGGCHRSGTSLVRRLLDSHSHVHCGPEVPFFRDFYGDYFDDPLRHLRFATTARTLLPEDELLVVLGRAFVQLHERAAMSQGKGRWADKAPENVLYLKEWERLLRDRWLFVHVVRNPLDTIASMMERPFPLTLPTDLAGRISHYLRYTAAGIQFQTSHPDRYRCVLYEQLATEPEETLASLMQWLGEQFEPAQLDLDGVRHQEGLEDPKIAVATQVHADSVGRWRSLLSRVEAEEIACRTEGLRPRFDLGGVLWPSAE